jgi:mono/diheme cytochrome c family protein
VRFPILLGLTVISAATAASKSSEVTFYKDVLPVLQKNCQQCHRAGEAAPMQLFTYKEARPWAKAMREAVITRKMPPWFADPHVGKFTNDRSMSEAEIDTIVKWADSGAKEGNAKDAPPPREFASGWIIGTPDVVYEMPEPYDVPSSGTIDYTYYIVPTGFTEDKWVQLAEARPGNRSVVHHIIAFARDPNSKWMREYPVGKAFVPNKSNRGSGEGGMGGGEFISGFAPGAPPEMLRQGQAKLIKAGSDIVFQMHYTTNGKAATDRSKVGLIFAKEKPTHRVLTLAAQNGKFVIPPGAPAHSVDGAITLQGDAELISMLPHMHLRGKSMEMRAVYPTGEMEKLLWVPNYDFNWQLWYQLPRGKVLPKGTRIEATGTFDNSPNNKNNPDPAKEVRWGDQSWEEMMIGFFDVAVPADMNPADLLRAPRKPSPTSED